MVWVEPKTNKVISSTHICIDKPIFLVYNNLVLENDRRINNMSSIKKALILITAAVVVIGIVYAIVNRAELLAKINKIKNKK